MAIPNLQTTINFFVFSIKQNIKILQIKKWIEQKKTKLQLYMNLIICKFGKPSFAFYTLLVGMGSDGRNASIAAEGSEQWQDESRVLHERIAEQQPIHVTYCFIKKLLIGVCRRFKVMDEQVNMKRYSWYFLYVLICYLDCW